MNKKDFEKTINMLEDKKLNLAKRTIPYEGGRIEIFYIPQITDRVSLTNNVIKPLILHCASSSKKVSSQVALDDIIYADRCRIESDDKKILQFILSGMTIILFSSDENYLAVDLRKVEHRTISSPSLQYTVRGPQDSFTENLDINISLVRYRLKDDKLRIKHFEVGKRSKTRVAVLYIEDIANNTAVEEIQKRIGNIDLDAIGESGELQSLLLNKKTHLFPQMGLADRSDLAFTSLIEGKVIVLVEGSGIALIAPKVFDEFFHSCDDRYDNKIFASFMRVIRHSALLISLLSSSIYVALTSFHTDALPISYVLSLAEMRSQVPINSFTAAFILEFVIELIREAMIRVPKQIGSAVGIVGTIVIGTAAIESRIFSPLLLILVSVSLFSSFAIPDYTLMNPFRVLKLLLLVMTGLFGFYGFSIVITFILVELVSINSFGVPYFSPWAPFNTYDAKRSLMYNITSSPKRPTYLRTKDKMKTGGTLKKDK